MLTGKIYPVLFWHRQLWKLIDILYPPFCAGCQRPGTRWCADCQNKTRQLEEPICPICGIPVDSPGKCQDCIDHNRADFLLRSWGIYEGSLRNAIHHLKYNNDIGVAEIFAGFMASKIASLSWEYDMIVPVPLTEKRKKERGYNQSALLARWIALETGSSLNTKALKRIRHTISQTRLSAAERRKNVEDAFWADAKIVRQKRVLLIDDIATTGATLEASTSALAKAGAKSIYSFTLARTL